MECKNIVYLSSNTIWGGSEVLWTRCAQKMLADGWKVTAGVLYDYSLLQPYLPDRKNYIDLNNRFTFSLSQRVLNKCWPGKFPPVDMLDTLFNASRPDLVVISQGNNVEAQSYMQYCVDRRIPFVTLTHLVTEMVWPALGDTRIEQLIKLYDTAKRNFFVSRHTLSLHQRMLGYTSVNSVVTYNPFTGNAADTGYPAINGMYKVLLLGRIENFHKGYDLLIDVLKQDKWKKRNIHFSIYGQGPHKALLTRLIRMHGIHNLTLGEHTQQIEELWEKHHILLMPSRMEGQSLTLIESMWFKRASIVTQVGGVEELVVDGRSGFIATFPTAQHIDDALERAWTRREEWQRMGETAYQLIRERHPSNAVDHFIQQLKEII